MRYERVALGVRCGDLGELRRVHLPAMYQGEEVTRGDVLEMACEAYGNWYPPIPAEMERFAALVAAHVRDECVKLCEGKPDARACAEAIKRLGRARDWEKPSAA